MARSDDTRAHHPVRDLQIIDAGLQARRSFSGGSAGPVIGHLLLEPVGTAAGIAALVWPGPTAPVLVLVVGIWALVGGFFEITAAFQAGETAGTRALFLPGWLASILFGIVLLARPGAGTVTHALLFGLINGISQVVMGIKLRQSGRTAHAALDEVA